MNRPLDGVVCSDLPLNVRDTQAAIEMVGGPEEIAQVSTNAAYAKDPEPLQSSLRNNRFHHPVASLVATQCRQIVVEIEVPTSCVPPVEKNRPDIRSALEIAAKRDETVKITPKFHVETSYRYRESADFQYYTGDSPFLKQTEKSLFAGNLAEIEKSAEKNELLATSSDPKDDISPPPRFSTSTQPFYYGYKQTPYLKMVDDGFGNQQLVHTIANVKVYSNILTWGDTVPQGPPSGLEKTPRSAVQNCIAESQQSFEQRPSYTRRWSQSYLGPIVSRYLKFALPYVAYYYRSGPWRGAYIKYGYDPAKHRELAQYQVEHFRITGDHEPNGESDLVDDEENGNSSNNNNGKNNSRSSSVAPASAGPASAATSASATSTVPKIVYTFDGTKFPSVPMLQLKDIVDGFSEQFVTTQDLRSQVDANDGWYKEDTATCIRRVSRAELVALKESKPPLTNAEKSLIVEEAREAKN